MRGSVSAEENFKVQMGNDPNCPQGKKRGMFFSHVISTQMSCSDGLSGENTAFSDVCGLTTKNFHPSIKNNVGWLVRLLLSLRTWTTPYNQKVTDVAAHHYNPSAFKAFGHFCLFNHFQSGS